MYLFLFGTNTITGPIFNGGLGYALFSGDNSGNYNLTRKYSYSNNVSITGTSLLTNDSFGKTGTGNYTVGIFFSGYTTTTGSKYIYSNDTVVSASVQTSVVTESASASNDILALFAGGIINAGSTYKNNIAKYTYSSDTSVATTTLSAGNAYLVGFGNINVAMFAGGYNGTTITAGIEKYIYITNVRSTGASLNTNKFGCAAAGNTTVGVVGAGNGPGGNQYKITQLYAYSGDTISGGTTLNYGGYGYSRATGNSTIGVFNCASGGGDQVEIYNYSNNTTKIGTNLPTKMSSALAATSSSPGGF